MEPFDPDAAAAPGSGLFGLPHGPDEARVHVLGVPFHATTSYRRGTADGPRAVLAASHQVDLFDLEGLERGGVPPWEAGIWMAPIDAEIEGWNEEATRLADPIIEAGGRIEGDATLGAALERVNAIGDQVNERVHARTAAALGAGKLPALIGGDHASPFGAIAACAERYPGLGVLHFDAHADLRDAYEGFTWSHASILFNVLERLDGVTRVVQVGVRDLGAREYGRIHASAGRVRTLFDRDWAGARHAGRDLAALVRTSLEPLPEEVYVTFDVDGLDPSLCPNTGTPVPGGLGWNEALLWLDELARSGRRVVGVDLCEVSPGIGERDSAEGWGESWDAAVGARLLYRLIGTALATK